LIFWQNLKVVPDAVINDKGVDVKKIWEKYIYPIMYMYARLFPGMVSILDISNLGIVTQKAEALIDRFLRDRRNPGFMPVTRDLSPATAHMVVVFLERLIKERS
jgi:hypothetical protein